MNLTVEIPDHLAERLAANGDDLSRPALEAFALGEYEARRLSTGQLRQVLGFETRYELDGFLKAQEVCDETTLDDLHRDLEDLKTALELQ